VSYHRRIIGQETRHIPEWGPETHIAIRKMVRDGIDAPTIWQAIEPRMRYEGFRSRCKRLGIALPSRKLAHRGETALHISKEDNERYPTGGC
jgi:hypothetical protein